MASFFTWLDHLPDDAQRVREALAALEQPGTVDPLGFGVVRDAFSELLFPGLSTVMTRARYFLFIPWIFRQVEGSTRTQSTAASKARELEVALIFALLDGSDEHGGIIGQNSRQTTKQLPSIIYWGGLGRLGIRRFPGSRTDFFATVGGRLRTGEDRPHHWHASIPDPPNGWLESTSLDMTGDEAEFLRDRILNTAPHTFLAMLARDADTEIDEGHLWDDPLVAACSPDVQHQIHHGKLFAIATWGAGLLYNLELERLREADQAGRVEPLQTLSRDFDVWSHWIDEVSVELESWNRDAMWATVGMGSASVDSARSFVDWWLDLVISKRGRNLDTPEVRRRLRDREIAVKGTRAKLANRRAREQSQGPSGEDLMTYRWPTARTVISDIVRATN